MAQTPAPAASAAPLLCPIRVNFDLLEGHDDEVVLTLWSDDKAGKATGTVVLYAGTTRYRIPFVDAMAADNRFTGFPPTPIVVRFDKPLRIDSAYVASLDGADCPVHDPAVTSSLQTFVQKYHGGPLNTYPDWSKIMQSILALAAHMQPIAASGGETVEAPACSKPYVMAYTRRAVSAPWPINNTFLGSVVVKVAVAPDGSVFGTRVDKSSYQRFTDDSAVDAAKRSQYAAQIYRCQPVSGTYIFIVTFAA